jgi:dinuclear metal center YbgI/SA1388 family protein
MPRLREILAELERVAPSRFAFSFDRVGLQVGDQDREVTRAVVSLDRSLAAVEYARSIGAELLLAHHPLIFRPIESVDTRTHVGRTIHELIRNDIAFVAAHTNWDSAKGGVNDTLAAILELSNVEPFGTASEVARFKMVTFVPVDVTDRIVDAATEAGAGLIGLYDRCAFVSDGFGSFRPQSGSQPTIGTVGDVSVVAEQRIEMVVSANAVSRVEEAVRVAHPYEEPAIDFVALRPWSEQPAGRVGDVEPRTLAQLVQFVDERLHTRSLAWGDPERKIRKVAVVGGAADDEWRAAQRAGADVLITGEVKQHNALEAAESGMCLISAGHFATEHPGCAALRDKMAANLSGVEWALFTPAPGQSGRPLD